MGEMIELTGGALAYRSKPPTDEGSGVLVLHAWWGLNAAVRAVCDRLAEVGFVALAPDLYDGVVVDTVDAAEAAAARGSTEDRLAIVRGAIDRLRGEPGARPDQLGLIGFSLGAAYGLRAAAEDPTVTAVVLCYGTGGTFDWSHSQAAFQGHWAESDPYEGTEEIEGLEAALRAAGRRVEFHRYPGVSHWFLEPDRPEYDEASATLAWGRILAFLRERLP